ARRRRVLRDDRRDVLRADFHAEPLRHQSSYRGMDYRAREAPARAAWGTCRHRLIRDNADRARRAGKRRGMKPVQRLTTPLLLASALGLGACAVGPNYRRPEISKVAKEPFKEAAVTGVNSAAPASSTWWRLYSDPTLSRLIEDAFRYNTDIRVAAANLRLARAQLSEARAGRLPTTDLSGSYSRQRVGADQIGPPAGGSAASTGGSGGASGPDHDDFNFYQAGFDASYEFDVFRRVSRSIEAARGDAQAAQAAL